MDEKIAFVASIIIGSRNDQFIISSHCEVEPINVLLSEDFLAFINYLAMNFREFPYRFRKYSRQKYFGI